MSGFTENLSWGLVVAASLGASGCHRPTPTPSAATGVTIAIAHTTVVGVGSDRSIQDATVLIAGTRVLAVGPSAAITIPVGARIVDGRGRWVIPGLWDMHVHLTTEGREALPLYIAHGVTGVRDMGGQFEVIQAIRREIGQGSLIGPVILAAGPILETAASIDGDLKFAAESERLRSRIDRIAIGDTAQARRVVDSIAALGVDFIKARNVENADVFWAIARAAHRHGLLFVGHPFNIKVEAEALADSGQNGIEHWYYPTDLPSLTPERYQRIAAAFVRNGTVIDPTIVAWQQHRLTYDSLRTLMDRALARAALLGPLNPALVDHWRGELKSRLTEGGAGPLTAAQLVGWNRALGNMAREIGRLHRAGVRIVAGSDLPLARLPGEGLQDELISLVELSGFTPSEALESATKTATSVLRVQDSLGIVAPHHIANLVLLRADPLLDIRNIRQVDAVVLRGRVVQVGINKQR